MKIENEATISKKNKKIQKLQNELKSLKCLPKF